MIMTTNKPVSIDMIWKLIERTFTEVIPRYVYNRDFDPSVDPFHLYYKPSGRRSCSYMKPSGKRTVYDVQEPCYDEDGYSHDGRFRFRSHVDNPEDFPNGHLVATCRMHEPIAIHPEEVDILEFDDARFFKAIGEVLNIDLEQKFEFDDLKSYALIGHYQPVPGRKFPVYWLASPNRVIRKSFVQQLALDQKTPAIVIIPTGIFLKSELCELLERFGHFCVDLAKILDIDENGRFVANTSLYQVLGNDLAGGPSAVAPPSYALERKGAQWLLRFDGNETMVKHLMGMDYIARLLESPDNIYLCTDLERKVQGTPSGKPRSAESGSFDEASEAADEIMDNEALRQVYARHHELQIDLEDAQACNDSGRGEEIQREIEELMDFLKQATSVDGKSRKFVREIEKCRVRVYKVISRAIQEIESHNPKASTWLRNNVRTGTSICHIGVEGFDWKIDY